MTVFAKDEQLEKDIKREAARARKAAREAARVEDEAKRVKERAEQFAKDTENYNERLLNVVIEFATIYNFEVEKRDDVTDVVFLTNKYGDHRDDYDEHRVALVPKHYGDLRELENAEAAVNVHHEKLEEEKRIAALRVAARAKLTDEEAKALGL